MDNLDSPTDAAASVSAVLDELNLKHGLISLHSVNNNWGFSDGTDVWVKVARMHSGLLDTELRVVEELRQRGFQTPEPLSSETQPVVVNDLNRSMSVWKFFPHTPMRTETQCVVAAAEFLHNVHEARIELPVRELDMDNTLEWIKRVLSSLDSSLSKELIERAEEGTAAVDDALQKTDSPFVFVHGDAHLGNIVETNAPSTLFIDWENAINAPREWDYGKLVPPALDGTMPCGGRSLRFRDSEKAWKIIRSNTRKLDMRLLVAGANMRMISSAVYALGFRYDEDTANRVCEYLGLEQHLNLSRHW